MGFESIEFISLVAADKFFFKVKILMIFNKKEFFWNKIFKKKIKMNLNKKKKMI